MHRTVRRAFAMLREAALRRSADLLVRAAKELCFRVLS
jgi:hypothetical protein